MNSMGEIVSLDEHRRARALRAEQAPPRAPIDRLARAVLMLETALTVAMDAEEYDEPSIRRELVAVHGAVAVGRYRMAADRTERLIERLRHA
jgi:hypothetical protein